MDNTINLKLVVLGEGEVGKTSIINSYIGKEIPKQYLPTIGSKTAKKEYIIEESGNIVRVLLSLWDIGGQRAFNPFNPALYQNIDIALLVFDLTRQNQTLELLKKEFLDNVNYHSEEALILFIGNKLDLLTNEQEIKSNLENFLAKNDNVMFVSAKTKFNIHECFELLIYIFLRKAEILYPDIVQENSAKLFLDLIKKKENHLKNRLVNLDNLDTALKKQKLKPKVKEENVEEKEIMDLKYYDFLMQELETNATQKNDVIDQFLINLTELENAINYLKKTHSKSVEDLIDNLKELLITTQKDFEKSIDLISKFNREEFELVQIISKTKKEQLKLE
ncbi:MAG: GTP-binding protein, partial [Promethearchaeota archaeon]